ncbi:MipA/OmpV family protein [Paracoccus denitrificans]|jgi:outer membrane protein|nr:MipA/OmpV family protein [Paracoccus denitrificans]MBB4627792.1 outer membrane protein [Paracoccus denitrificans]MCU7428671.1 MipA/OmpV family protein [Paracoccus denitrificans]UPV95297.1 MipA/OmpV family protein [Paracoccus denitrificans]WQO32645.1 MipA/OmpV family protein [Paracoccus denitrificans]SDI57964.1 outer membrane protein [Paracoccus denitrificans]
MKKKTSISLARLCAAAFALGCAGAASQAMAQDRMIFGLGAASAPEYQGSDQQSARAIPLIDIARGPFFMNLRNGIGAYPLEYGDFRFGTSIVYIPGFDLPHALGEVSGSAGARLFTDWERGGVNATFGVTRAVSGDLEGTLVDASLSYRHNVTPKLTLIPVIGTTWSDSDYTNSYFGVTPAQAAAAGISSFSPGGGFKDVSIGLTANYRVTERVNLTASATMSKLLGDAKDSPIVFDDTQAFGFIGVSYRFGN